MTRILIGMHDYDTGLDLKSFQVTTNFPLDGIPAGENLASLFRATSDSVWEFELETAVNSLANGELTILVADRQGNRSRLVRTFSVGQK